ncbi:MAG: anthranilate synthase component I family protein [Euryarchaeota archaeon]|nr:anthranilate synthase component I family protein [Euryarchaeota archaeon]
MPGGMENEEAVATGITGLSLSYEEFLTSAQGQKKPLIISVCAESPLPAISPADAYSLLCHGKGVLLESLEGSEKIATYSYVGITPRLMVTIGDEMECKGDERYLPITGVPDGNNAVDQIKSVMQKFNFVSQKQSLRVPRFSGGMAGYFSYDIISSLYPHVEIKGRGESSTPLAEFMLISDYLVFDHSAKKLYIFCNPLLTEDSDPAIEYEKSIRRISAIREALTEAEAGEAAEESVVKRERSLHSPEKLQCRSNISKDEFEMAVEQVSEYIHAGEILQAVISQRMECEVHADPLDIYRVLREANPSPYMYYLDFGERKVVGSSPEMLVRVENEVASTVPIAGTRPRGRNSTEDTELAEELLKDEKECAEHLMLVDLARNDLGSVCEYGTVTLSDFMEIEKFSHVQHIVSTVQGELRADLDCYETLKACFPAGTVSGAPKIRAMQIIDDLERSRRGIYAGAVGWIGFNRNLEFAIAIRTILLERKKAYLQVGAGIVADSVPEREWEETLNKAAGMLKAIEIAEGIL